MQNERLPRCQPRHWFTAYGQVGERKPFCLRCKAPHPKTATCLVCSTSWIKEKRAGRCPKCHLQPEVSR